MTEKLSLMMATMTNEIKLVRLQWIDIIRPDETWMFIEEVKKLEPAVITTMGWVVHYTEDYVTIASSLGDDKQLGDINCIPRSCIRSIEYLGETYEDFNKDIDIPII